MLKELDKDVLGWEPNQERNKSPEDWMKTDAPLAGQTSWPLGRRICGRFSMFLAHTYSVFPGSI